MAYIIDGFSIRRILDTRAGAAGSGRRLMEHLIDEGLEPVLVEGRIRIPYRWPAGRAGGRFLAALQQEGLLLGLRCPACGTVSVPPRARCLRCRVACEEWVPVGPEGTVETWTVARRAAPPAILALIRLDGAGTALLHRLLDVEPEAIHSGMRVRAVPETERRAQITDIAGFRPVAGP